MAVSKISSGGYLNRLGRYLVLLTGVGGAVGGTTYYQNQRFQEAQEANRVTHERKLSDLEEGFNKKLAGVRSGFDAKLWFETRKSEALISEANKKLEEQGAKFNEDLRQARTQVEDLKRQANEDKETTRTLNEELKRKGEAIDNLASGLSDLSQKVSSLSEPEKKLLKVIQGALPSTFVISAGPKGEYTWSGFFIRVGEKRYGVTCGHSYSDVVDFSGIVNIKGVDGGKLKIRGYKDLYKFQMTPQPLSDGTVAFLNVADGDQVVFPVSDKENSELDRLEKEKEIKIGLKIRDLTKPLEPGEPLFNNGYPEGWEFSVGRRHVMNTVKVSMNKGKPQDQVQVLPGFNSGDSGSALIDSNGEVAGMATWVKMVTVPMGFGITNRQLKIAMAEKFGIEEVLEPHERSLRQTEKLARTFMFPTPMNIMPLGNFIPSQNSEQKRRINVNTLNALSRFLMPTPMNPIPIVNLLPEKSKK